MMSDETSGMDLKCITPIEVLSFWILPSFHIVIKFYLEGYSSTLHHCTMLTNLRHLQKKSDGLT